MRNPLFISDPHRDRSVSFLGGVGTVKYSLCLFTFFDIWKGHLRPGGVSWWHYEWWLLTLPCSIFTYSAMRRRHVTHMRVKYLLSPRIWTMCVSCHLFPSAGTSFQTFDWPAYLASTSLIDCRMPANASFCWLFATVCWFPGLHDQAPAFEAMKWAEVLLA